MFRIMQGLFGSDNAGYAFAPDATQRHELGLHAHGVSPYWGGGEFVYAKAGGTLEMGSLVQADSNWLMIDVPNTANTGRNFYVAIYPMVLNDFGWFQNSGQMVLSATASVAADTAIGITAAGQVGANSAGKQVLGYRNLLPGTTTVVKTCKVTSGTGRIEIVNGDIRGWFHNVTLSGTGIPASSEITALDQSLREVTMSELATASGSAVSVTGTYTGFLVGIGDHPHVQGAIT